MARGSRASPETPRATQETRAVVQESTRRGHTRYTPTAVTTLAPTTARILDGVTARDEFNDLLTQLASGMLTRDHAAPARLFCAMGVRAVEGAVVERAYLLDDAKAEPLARVRAFTQRAAAARAEGAAGAAFLATGGGGVAAGIG